MDDTSNNGELSLYTIKDAARQMKVGTPRVHELIEKGEIGVIRFDSGRIRIPQMEITRWIQEKIIFRKPEQIKANRRIVNVQQPFDATSSILKIISKEGHA